MKNKLINNIILIASILVFAFILNQYGYQNISENLSKVGLWIFPIAGVWLLVYALNTLAFKLIANNKLEGLGFFKALSLTVSSYGLNYLTPVVALGGEVYKTNVLKEYTDTETAASIVVNYYSIHVLSHIAFWILGGAIFIFNMELTGEYLNIIFMLGAFVLVMLGLFYLFFEKKALVPIYKNISKWIRPIKLQSKMQANLSSIEQVSSQITGFYNDKRSKFLLATLFEFVARIVASYEIVFIVNAIGIDMSIQNAIFFTALSSLLLNLLFFVPMQMGSREGIYYMIMSSIGITSGVGIYISLTTRIRELIWIMLGLIALPINKVQIADKAPETDLIN